MTLPAHAEARVRRHVAVHDLLPRGSTIICAVSGGADSLSLLAWLEARRESLGISLHAAHVHHGIAEARSDEAATAVRALCQAHGIPLHEHHVDVPALAQQWRTGVEDAGRRARQAWFRSLARRLDARVATGHTADDQAETVLMRALRGSGPRGLAGIRARLGAPPWLVRPFLPLRRSETRSMARSAGLPVVDDPTNDDPGYGTRNLIRLSLIPLLEQRFNPNVVGALCRLAEAAAAESIALRAVTARLARRLVQEGQPRVVSSRLARLPRGLRVSVLGKALAGIAPRRGDAHDLARLDDLMRGAIGRRTRAAGVTAQRTTRGVELGDPPLGRPHALGEGAPLPVPGEVRLAGWVVRASLVQHAPAPCARRDLSPQGYRWAMQTPWRAAIVVPSAGLRVRGRRAGDRWHPSRGSGSRKLKATLNAWAVPEAERDAVPIVTVEDTIACVAGWGPDAHHATHGSETAAIMLEFTFEEREQA